MAAATITKAATAMPVHKAARLGLFAVEGRMAKEEVCTAPEPTGPWYRTVRSDRPSALPGRGLDRRAATDAEACVVGNLSTARATEHL